MKKPNEDENSKDPNWPMDQPGVRPEDYDKSIPSGHGSAKDPAKDSDTAREEQKRRKQLPLHDEPIGGA